MKLINLRKLSELYLAYFNLWKTKWKIAFVFLNENTLISTQSEWWLLETWLPLSTTTECSRNFAFSRLAFSLSLTDSKGILSSSHLDYCSRIAGNASDQDATALRRKPLNNVNWSHWIGKFTCKGNRRQGDTETPMKNIQNETHGFNRTDHCGTKA